MNQEYLSMFIDETREHLQAWSDGLIDMEKTGSTDSVPTIFRAAHTIKGMSMTMGFNRMGEVTHKAENLLDDLRNAKISVTSNLITALLHALDVLEELLNGIENGGDEPDIDFHTVVQELASCTKSGAPAAPVNVPTLGTMSPSPAAATAVATKPASTKIMNASISSDIIETVASKVMEQGFRVYEIEIGFADSCVMPLARFAQWLQLIDQNNILYMVPDATVIDAGDYTGAITVVLASTADVEAVGKTLDSVSEVIIKSMSEWTRSTDSSLNRSENLLPQDRHITDDESVKSVIAQVLNQGLHVYEVGILLAETCQMKSARIYMLFESIGGQNHLLFTTPHIQQIEKEEMERYVLFVMWSSEGLQQVHRALDRVPELEIVELREWHTQDNDAVRGPNQSGALNATASTQQSTERRKMSTIRVDTDKLDELMNLVSELVIDKTRLERIRGEIGHGGLTETVDHMSRLSSQLQELIMSIRMVPVESVFNRFPRMVRDTAQQLKKEVEFVITGQDTELDRTVVEEIGDPIMHMLRNSLDHGVEEPLDRSIANKSTKGKIELRAYAAGNHVFIEVEDDGRGINREKVLKKAIDQGLVKQGEHLSDHQVYQLLFASGFSTADQISDLSGRGVGLDVVRAKIESLSGKIDIYSEEGKGTRFVVRLPMTLAIMDGLMVRIGDHPYLIPISSIAETDTLKTPKAVHGEEVVIWRGRVVPLVRARNIFNEPESDKNGFVVFVNRGEKVVGIVVDELIGQFEVVLKTLDQKLKKIPYFAGATILGDGEVALIIDANSFIE